MKFSRAINPLKALIAVLIILIFCVITANVNIPVLRGQAGPAGYFSTLQPNAKFTPMVFTATSQTKKQALSGFSSATLQIYGPATSCILQVKGSNDGGTNYFAIPYSTGAYTSNVLSVVTGAAFTTYNNSPVMYWLNVADLTNIEVVSSSTFTGASCTVQITASSNKGLF